MRTTARVKVRTRSRSWRRSELAGDDEPEAIRGRDEMAARRTASERSRESVGSRGGIVSSCSQCSVLVSCTCPRRERERAPSITFDAPESLVQRLESSSYSLASGSTGRSTYLPRSFAHRRRDRSALRSLADPHARRHFSRTRVVLSLLPPCQSGILARESKVKTRRARENVELTYGEL